jgi:hypothetical protein
MSSIILLTIGLYKSFEVYLNCFHTNQSQWRLTFSKSQLCGRSLKSQRVIVELLCWQIRKAAGFIALEKKERQPDGGVLCTKSSESYSCVYIYINQIILYKNMNIKDVIFKIYHSDKINKVTNETLSCLKKKSDNRKNILFAFEIVFGQSDTQSNREFCGFN